MRTLATCSVSIILTIIACHLASCAGPAKQPEGNGLAGSASCAACHEQEARFCGYGAHRTVECERCHGPGAAHARAEAEPRPDLRLGDVDLCLSCHRRGSGSGVASGIESFEDHLTELELEHRIRLDREKSGTGCVYCHDPHLLE